MASPSDTPELFTPAPLPVAVLSDAERLACLRLIRSDNVGPVTFRELINHCGGAQAALDALPHLSRRGGGKTPLRICSVQRAEDELRAAHRIGAAPVFTIEPGYPKLLATIPAPPPLIYVKGEPELLNRPGIAIVGSRNCSAAGSKLAQTIAADLSAAGYVIVSGLARGIDGVAHEAALAGGTVAVLAGGLDIIYPPEHDALHARIAANGCLITELPPGFKPRAADFPRRNRIISGVSYGVVIVEAAARSGTLVTARYAGEQGREVFAVPGHPLDPRAEGTNTLIKRGATLVTSAADIIEVLRPISGLAEAGPLVPFQLEQVADAGLVGGTPPDVGDSERDRVAGALGPAPVDIDALVRATGLSSRHVHIALMELDLAGRIERMGHGLVALKATTD